MAKQMLSPPSHPEMMGRLGRYEIERMIGAGGMGVVFKAFDSELNRPVAIKVLAPFLSGSGSARKRFAREARAAAAIVHEHVVPIYNVETERDAPYLVMQYVAGESLQSRIDRSGPLQICEILRIGIQIASGLFAAHQQGLVHRDIKPANILLEQGIERALITDFGLARAADDAALTCSGIHPGTPQYMSPEQAAGEPVDTRSDLFSLGSVLYTMCTGRPPFRAETSLGVMRRIADDQPRRIREINPNMPDWLCNVIGKLMSKKASDRYDSASSVAILLEKCLAHVQQPDFIRLPAELVQPEIAPFRPQSFIHRIHRNMFKIIGSIGIAATLLTILFLPKSDSAALAELQGEWLLVASERDGKPLPADQLFNERLIIEGTKFSRPQTAPNGTEITGESGRLLLLDEPDDAIDWQLWEGTIHGVYKLRGDKLILCIARDGAPRPDSFKTAAGDSRVLYTYHRKQNSKIDNAAAQTIQADRISDGKSRRAWIESWTKKVAAEVPDSVDRAGAKQWLQENGFQNIKDADITQDVVDRIHPRAGDPKAQNDGIRTYVYGILRATSGKEHDAVIEAFYLFDENEKLIVLHVGPPTS